MNCREYLVSRVHGETDPKHCALAEDGQTARGSLIVV